jgi:hypothetical protein
MMMTRTASFKDQMDNLKKLIEGLSTLLKAKDHEIRKLIYTTQQITGTSPNLFINSIKGLHKVLLVCYAH